MTTHPLFCILPLLLATLLLGACGEPAATDDHAGHQHGPGEGHGKKAAAPAETCAAHGVPKTACFICDPALRDPARLWCKEHDRYEDRCWACHPDARDKNRAFCDEHGLYEDECHLCRPEFRKTASKAANTSGALMCGEHGVPEAACGICRPEEAAHLKPGQSMQVRLPAADSAEMVGLETATAQTGNISDGIACYAELAFNQNKLAQIGAPVGGIVREVLIDLGNTVKEGQPVARIWSAAIAESVAKAVLTHQTLERERKLHADGIAAAKDLQEAEAAHRAACQQARTLGFSEEDINTMGLHPDEPVLLEVRAPFTGEITERKAVRGAAVESGQALFTVVDRSTMWAELHIPESHLVQVRVGLDVELSIDSLPGRSFRGKLTWISAQVDERTRMARARAEFANTDGALRDRMFARARIITRQAESAMLLPASALQYVDNKPIVFVRREADLYDARSVRIGATENDRIEVLAGLQPDEVVVVARAFTVKSQLLISKLGAGCADD